MVPALASSSVYRSGKLAIDMSGVDEAFCDIEPVLPVGVGWEVVFGAGCAVGGGG